jgi:hypothetical protein
VAAARRARAPRGDTHTHTHTRTLRRAPRHTRAHHVDDAPRHTRAHHVDDALRHAHARTMSTTRCELMNSNTPSLAMTMNASFGPR